MASLNFTRNDAFLSDADFVFAHETARKELVQVVGRLAGRGRKRREVYSQLKDFMDDFRKHPIGRAKSGNEQLTEMLKYVGAGRIDWPIAPFLAWLCYYHRDEAVAFYASSGLASKFDIRLRQYLGRPGDRAKVAKGSMVPQEESENDRSNPSPEIDAIQGGDSKWRDAHTQFDQRQKEPLTKAALAWETTCQEVSIPPYRSFMARHPATPEAKLAEDHINDLELWESIPQANPFAVREFIDTGRFPALSRHARAKLDEAKAGYVDGKTAKVKAMFSGQQPDSFLVIFPFAFFGLVFWMVVAFVAVGLAAAAHATILRTPWPTFQIAGYIAQFSPDAVENFSFETVEVFNRLLAVVYEGQNFGLLFQFGAVFLIYAFLTFFLVSKFVGAVANAVEQTQEPQIEQIRKYHLAKVAEL